MVAGGERESDGEPMGKTDESADEERGKDRGSTKRGGGQGGSGGAVYGLGMIGALIYFGSKAEKPEEYLMAVGKSFVWPALMVFQAFKKLDS